MVGGPRPRVWGGPGPGVWRSRRRCGGAGPSPGLSLAHRCRLPTVRSEVVPCVRVGGPLSASYKDSSRSRRGLPAPRHLCGALPPHRAPSCGAGGQGSLPWVWGHTGSEGCHLLFLVTSPATAWSGWRLSGLSPVSSPLFPLQILSVLRRRAQNSTAALCLLVSHREFYLPLAATACKN